ncbi:MAG TPA: molybdopterin cofactor-binding domain-containing protein [Victivallales bacterium]|nr:molybdopterin cofactor-binding domain-containing protein [Victivallales bacterium]
MGNVVGKKVPRIDGYEKVTGKAVYSDDIKIHGMLYAAQRYTDYPSAIIKKIDTSKASAIPGVKRIILQDDIPGQITVGHVREDQKILVKDQAFYSGDVIAVVAAETLEIANKAADSIEIEYEELEGIFNVHDALKDDARLIHPEYKSNVVLHYPLRKGNVEKGFEDSDQVLEREYNTGFHEHAYIETESAIAIPDPSCRGIKLHGSFQCPFTTRKFVAKCLDIKLNQVNVNGTLIGGSFGGKDDTVSAMAARVSLLAKLTDRPVKLTLSRENSIKESYKRHPYCIKHKIGFNKNGKIQALKINILADSGAYSSMSFFVTWRSVVQAAGPYEIPNVHTDVRSIYTNNTYTAAFRGFGSPQIIYAQESLMDEIADICNITPYEIRKLNGFKQNSITASGQVLDKHTVSLNQVIDEAVKKSDYFKKVKNYKIKNSSSNRYKYGIGMASSYRGCCLGAEGVDATSAIVSVQLDGSVYLQAGLNENGQGLRTTFGQIAAEVLGAKFEDIHFLEPQTAQINDGGPTVASRSTLMGGNATLMAAQEIKERIFNIIKTDLEVSTIDELDWKDGFIYASNGKSMPFKGAAFRAYQAGVNLSAYGWYKAPEVSWDEETGQGNAYFTYVYGCQIIDLRIDTHTGKIEVEKVTAAHDVGKTINRLGAEGQIYGGVAQGLGYGIWEHYNIQNGELKSENLDEYLIPTIKDINKIEPIIIENPDADGPLGAKSLGEPTLELGAAAVNNAVSNALGKRFYEIPLTLEKIFLDKQLVKPSRASEAGLSSSGKKQSPRLSNITYTVPNNLNEALKLLNDKKYTIFAGGTDVAIELRKATHKTDLLYVGNLKEITSIESNQNEIIIGAAAKYKDIINNDKIKNFLPALVEACSTIGAKQTRNMGTIGGNIANAAPCGDSIPPLIAYNAELELASAKGTRRFKIEDFITGSYRTHREYEELITKIIIPKPSKRYKYGYIQLGRRGAVNITRISSLALVSFDKNDKIEECILAHGALFSKPGRFYYLESLLIGQKLTEKLINSIDEKLSEIIEQEIGGRWSSEYKKPAFINICKDTLKALMK